MNHLFRIAVMIVALSAGAAAAVAQAPAAPGGRATTEDLAKLKSRQLSGQVSAFDATGQSFTVKNRRGQSETFVFRPELKVKRGKESLKPADLKPGTRVTVHYWEKEGKKTAQRVSVDLD
jgi:hypothetical protein